jgi:hypothetical protein
MRKLPDNCHWEVISDPLEVGGFTTGTRLSTIEVMFMLKYHTFTLGSVIQHKQLGRFTVKSVLGNRPRLAQRERLPFFLKNGKYVGKVRNQNLRISQL